MSHKWLDNCSVQISTNDNSTDDVMYFEECVLFLTEFLHYVAANITPAQDIFFSTAFALLAIFGAIGNGLMVWAIIRKPAMRTSANVIISNLALSNLVLSLLLYPILWVPDKTSVFPYGRFMCKLITTLPAINIVSSSLSICVITIMRYYITQLTHVFVESETTVMKSVIMALGIWVASTIFTSPLLFLYDTHVYPWWLTSVNIFPNGTTKNFSWTTCQLLPNYSIAVYQQTSIIISATQVVFLCVLPSLTLVVFNYKTVTHFLRRRRSMHTQILQTYDNSPEIRLIALLTAMSASYAILWLPGTLVPLLTVLEVIERPGRWLFTGSQLISLLSIGVNPVVYGYFNTNFRQEFKHVERFVSACVRSMCCRNPSDNTSEVTLTLLSTKTTSGERAEKVHCPLQRVRASAKFDDRSLERALNYGAAGTQLTGNGHSVPEMHTAVVHSNCINSDVEYNDDSEL